MKRDELPEGTRHFVEDIELATTQIELLIPLISLIGCAYQADPDNELIKSLYGAAEFIEDHSAAIITDSERKLMLSGAARTEKRRAK